MRRIYTKAIAWHLLLLLAQEGKLLRQGLSVFTVVKERQEMQSQYWSTGMTLTTFQ